MFEVLHLEERNHKARGNQICYSLCYTAIMMEKKDCLRKMMVDSKWFDLPNVKTKKCKDATTTVMNIHF